MQTQQTKQSAGEGRANCQTATATATTTTANTVISKQPKLKRQVARLSMSAIFDLHLRFTFYLTLTSGGLADWLAVGASETAVARGSFAHWIIPLLSAEVTFAIRRAH